MAAHCAAPPGEKVPAVQGAQQSADAAAPASAHALPALQATAVQGATPVEVMPTPHGTHAAALLWLGTQPLGHLAAQSGAPGYATVPARHALQPVEVEATEPSGQALHANGSARTLSMTPFLATVLSERIENPKSLPDSTSDGGMHSTEPDAPAPQHAAVAAAEAHTLPEYMRAQEFPVTALAPQADVPEGTAPLTLPHEPPGQLLMPAQRGNPVGRPPAPAPVWPAAHTSANADSTPLLLAS